MVGSNRWLWAFAAAALSVLSECATAQDAVPTEQVQAVISGLRTPQEAFQVDRHLGHIPGVLLTRTDLHTSNLYMLVRVDSPDQKPAVTTALERMGLRMGCWSRTPRTGEPFVHLDPARCDELPQLK